MIDTFAQWPRRNSVGFAIATVCALVPASAAAQIYEGQPCACGEQKTGKHQGFPKHLVFDGYIGEQSANASSCLYAGKYQGKKVALEIPEGPTDDWEPAREAYDQHTCRYAAHAVSDNDPKTAWCAASGLAVGEVVGAYMGRTYPNAVDIVAGYAKSKKLHRLNSRPKKVRLHLRHVERVEFAQVGSYLIDLKPLLTFDTILKDSFASQRVEIPSLARHKAVAGGAYTVFLEILSVYSGSRYKDVCVSEIHLVK